MAQALDVIAGALSLYLRITDALARGGRWPGTSTVQSVLDAAVVVGVTVLALALGAATLRCRTA